MFTGIIEDLGSIATLTQSAAGAVVTIRTQLPLARIAIGESIAVNGCCLTVTKKVRGGFTMDISAESLRRTTLGQLKPGDRINLERCLTLDKLLGGHLVSGHVDGVGAIVSIAPEGDSRIYTFDAPALVARYLVEKGSVAIDGISLTVFDIRKNRFRVALIPHTLKLTTLGVKRAGDAVNLESDMLVKYVERVATPYMQNGHARGAKRKSADAARLAVSKGLQP